MIQFIIPEPTRKKKKEADLAIPRSIVAVSELENIDLYVEEK